MSPTERPSAGADQAGQQDQPIRHDAELFVDPVNGAACAQKYSHARPISQLAALTEDPRCPE
jgi:hypothetical protein